MCSITFGVNAGDAALSIFCALVGLLLGATAMGGIFFRRRKKDEERLAAHRERFLADLAHELQTPIAILRGNLEIVENCAPMELIHPLRVMRTTLDSIARFAMASLAGERVKLSRRDICNTVIDVRSFLEGICEDCFVLAEYNDVKMSVMSEDVCIMGDKDKLREVMLNLVSNAFKHTLPGGLVSLAARQVGDRVEIAVEDTGSGISPGDMLHLFERFYRMDDHGSGNGIGLYLCRQIIEAHRGGTIFAESELGNGSRFVIQLPIYLL